MPILEVPLLVIIDFMKLVFFKYHNLNKFDRSEGLKCYNDSKKGVNSRNPDQLDKY